MNEIALVDGPFGGRLVDRSAMRGTGLLRGNRLTLTVLYGIDEYGDEFPVVSCHPAVYLLAAEQSVTAEFLGYEHELPR